ncbi:amidase [Caulobacter sp. NIBR2454]|uniref:amidase n=1 Tax=Caulobacter sp. NIBR2454 TaxID=3015996 RepID=UPI0022B684B5|nr:amidase family protein [Caulobacter sp. NIBR2454]
MQEFSIHIDEYARQDATGLAALIRSGEVSAAEVKACALAAIEAVDPAIQAVLDAPRAAPTSLHAGPLAGVPFLIKDLGPTLAGLRSEAGSRLCAGHVATQTSHLVDSYLRAGLAVVGRTKSAEFGFSATTEPALYGPARNPWNPLYSPGGSSGGSAAAVAAGAAPAAHANDAGGSIRIPAAFCGLVGLKPSRGRISVGPAMSEAVAGLGVDHVVTRTVRDTALLLDIAHGPRPGDPYGVAAPDGFFVDAVRPPRRRLRIAVVERAFDGGAIDPQITAALRETADHLAELGHGVERIDLALGVRWGDYVGATLALWCANIAQVVDGIAAATGRAIDASTLQAGTLQAYRHGKSLPATGVFDAYATLNTVRQTVARHFADIDLLLSPVTPRLTPRIGAPDVVVEGREIAEWGADLFAYVGFASLFNVTGGPAISLPLHQCSEGMPLGLQFAAAPGDEALLLSIAAELENSRPWSGRRPTIFAA